MVIDMERGGEEEEGFFDRVVDGQSTTWESLEAELGRRRRQS